MKISIREVVGENCITFEAGEKVYDLIHSELRAGRGVELDFSGVRVIVSLFLNAAIGRLLENVSSDELTRLLKVTNLSSTGWATLKQVVANSKEYYTDPKVREAVDKILTEQAA
jgi:hypothetical protein